MGFCLRLIFVISLIVVQLTVLLSIESLGVRYYVEETIRDILRKSPIDDYDFWYFFDSGQDFANLGYAPLIDFSSSDPEAWQKQLYFELFKKADNHSKQVTHWDHVNIVELASGKGGGLKAIKQDGKWSFTIDSATGIERSYQGWNRANKSHTGVKNLQYVNADARSLPLPSASYEIVLSLEANGILFQTAFQEIRRILKDDGVFVLSTIIPESTWRRAVETLHSSGFVFCEGSTFDNITQRVQQARDEQDPVMQEMINRMLRKYLYVIYPLTGFIDEGFRRPSSKYYQKAFVDKEEVYLSACFQKSKSQSFGRMSLPEIIDV